MFPEKSPVPLFTQGNGGLLPRQGCQTDDPSFAHSSNSISQARQGEAIFQARLSPQETCKLFDGCSQGRTQDPYEANTGALDADDDLTLAGQAASSAHSGKTD